MQRNNQKVPNGAERDMAVAVSQGNRGLEEWGKERETGRIEPKI